MEEQERLSLDELPMYNISLSPPNRWIKRLLHVSDTIVSLLIITPLAVAHWRGTWTFMDYHEEIFPPWHCFLLGSVLHTAFALLRESLHEEFSTTSDTKSICRTIKHFIISKTYTYIFSIACILQWRGGWAVLDYHFGHTPHVAIIVTAVTFVILVAIRCVRNTLAPPFVIIMDYRDSAFIFPTRFRIEGGHKPGLYVLDCAFSVLCVGTLVVFVWRGVWLLMDLYLFPTDTHLSAFLSLAIGYGTVAVIFAIQPIMRWTCERLEGLWRVAATDVFLSLSFVGTVSIWRGVWYCIDFYFLPHYLIESIWITHAASLILLAFLNCSNSVLLRGVYIDAEEPAGQCVVFPVYYIRQLFQKERSRKQKRLLNTLERHDNNTFLLIEDPTNNVRSNKYCESENLNNNTKIIDEEQCEPIFQE
ncbi:uncharacterized protein LOC132263474 [Phlebotomus argentipes]|uniref:uncharacterized protein LOC132263474 n=1 Tax=Phlebotomus argentipes TaxID=94469 RepID=UPI002892E47D|nr:uncharacterized protein LOC132263474 [Phlebotomus argentipes]